MLALARFSILKNNKVQEIQIMRDLILLQRTNIHSADCLTDYLKAMENEYNQLKPFLPTSIKNVLDIGCGMGGIDTFLYRDYKPRITFLDRDGIDKKIVYGYHGTSSKYNLLSETKKFVEAQGVRGASYINIDQEPFPEQEFDLAVSFLAMGYHFPFDTHKPNAKSLIADIRDGQPILKTWEIIYRGENYRRILCRESN